MLAVVDCKPGRGQEWSYNGNTSIDHSGLCRLFGLILLRGNCIKSITKKEDKLPKDVFFES